MKLTRFKYNFLILNKYNEKKFKKMEKEGPNEMEMAKKEDEKRKA